VIEPSEYIQDMTISYPLLKPTINQAIKSLRLPKGSHGLDAGCGIGLQVPTLVEEVGPHGHITGLDISHEFIQYAEDEMNDIGLSKQVSFKTGDIRALPYDDSNFDWVWSSCCAGYAATLDPPLVIRELARVVKPGGMVAIFAWSSERILPGYPVLEARLSATSPGIAPYQCDMDPEIHFSRGLGWFRNAGLVDLKVCGFVGDTHAPLGVDIRTALVSLFAMRWPGVETELTQSDLAEYQRLCLPDSPDFIVDHPDYYGFFTCSMFTGNIPIKHND